MKDPRFVLKPMIASALASLLLAAAPAFGDDESQPGISGGYLEVRSCDVYTGPCFANAEMGLDGKEAILVWAIEDGSWNETDLSGLSVIAVVRTKDTLGDLKYAQPKGDAVLIVDQNASTAQQAALAAFAKATAKKLIGNVIHTHTAPIDTTIGDCTKRGTRARVTAGGLVNISTRCLCEGDHVCGNEYLYYPPLTKVQDAKAAYTEMFSFRGDGLNAKWATTGLRSAYVGAFAM